MTAALIPNPRGMRSRSPRRTRAITTLLGVVRTAQKCEVDMLAYLTWMFERRGSHRARFGQTATELTPKAYRKVVETAVPLAA